MTLIFHDNFLKISHLMQLWSRHFVGGKPSPTRNDPDYCPSQELGYGGQRPKTKADKERFKRHTKRMHVGNNKSISVPKDTPAEAEQLDEHTDMIVENNERWLNVAGQAMVESHAQVKGESNKNKCPAPGCKKIYKGRAWLSLHWSKIHEKDEEKTLAQADAEFSLLL